MPKPSQWTTEHDTFIAALDLQGTSVTDIIAAGCYSKETDQEFLKPGWATWIRNSKLRVIRRSLKSFQKGTRTRSKYTPVPADYDINSVAYLRDRRGNVKPLPVFTIEHYNKQFSTSNAHTRSCSSSPLPRKNNATMPSRSPNRSPTRVKFDVGTPGGESVTSLTTSILEMTLDAKLRTVDPQAEEFDDAVYAEVGADNQCDIILKELNEVKVEKGKSWMKALQVIKPLESKELNERMLEGEAELVKVDVEGTMRKAVIFKTPLSFTRTHADMKSAACIADATFGKHNNRRNALEGAVLPADGKVFKETLIILPELEVMDPEEKPQTYSNKYFNRTEDGRVPEDGHLNAAVSFKPGDDTTLFFMFGKTKVPLPTAYIMAQLAIEGTKEAIKKGATGAGKNLDYDAYLTAQKDLENKMQDDSEDEDN